MWKARAGNGKTGTSEGGCTTGKSRCIIRRRDVERNKVVKREPYAEKLLLCNACPYRKPTQVDEERILRPTEEALLRNSAK